MLLRQCTGPKKKKPTDMAAWKRLMILMKAISGVVGTYRVALNQK